MHDPTVDSSSIICEFLEVLIHGVLYNRKLYPEGIFTLKKKYGVPIHVSKDPDLNQYIRNTLLAITHLLRSQQLNEVNICFFNKEGKLLERFVIGINELSSDIFSSSYLPSLQQLKESFRALCLKLSVNSNFMKPLPEGSNFKIFIHTLEESSAAMAEDPKFQDFPWVEAQKKDVNVEHARVIPLRNIETNLVNLRIYSEENHAAK